LLNLSGSFPSASKNTSNELTTSQLAKLFQEGDEETRRLIDLYQPLCQAAASRFVVAHLGQSLDGRIAAANGASRWITGPEDVLHNHRMRALFEAVVVGAGTICYDDPQLTVRAVEGRSPVRVIVDPRRRLGTDYKVFADGEAETLLLCDAAVATTDDRHGRGRVVGVETEDGQLAPAAVLDQLDRLGLKRIFVEGGGVTVSRFLEAGCLDRLQITVAPMIIGSGRPSISLPEITDVGAGLRPKTRHAVLGDDILFECCFDESG
jgi:riboflavin-specific deaminase-like protein